MTLNTAAPAGALPLLPRVQAIIEANQSKAVNSYGGTVGGTLDSPDPTTARMFELFAQTFEKEVLPG